VTRRYRKRNAKPVVAVPAVAAPPEPSLLDKLLAEAFATGKTKPCKYAGIVDGCFGVFTLGKHKGTKEVCDNSACKKRLRAESNNLATARYYKNNKPQAQRYRNGPKGYNRLYYLDKHPDANPTFGDRTQTAETRTKISAAGKGRKHTPEHTAKIAAANKGRKRTPETCAKIGLSKKGGKLTPEHRAKISAGLKAASRKRKRKVSAETRAKISATLTGRKRKFIPEHRANLKAAWAKRRKKR
jgi:hypothetical protein